MASLPRSLDVSAPQAERPSTAAVRPTDFGLGDAAQDVGQWAKAQQVEIEAKRRLQERTDAKAAAEVLRPYQAQFESGFAERAQTEDGLKPNFAASTLAHLDDHMMGVMASLPDDGVREQARQQLDRWRGQVGERAIETQSNRRAAIVQAQEREKDQAAAGAVLAPVNAEWAAAKQTLADSYDGSQPDFAGDVAATHDRITSELYASPDFQALAPQVQSAVRTRLTNDRLEEHAKALETAAAGHDAFVARAATATADAAINNVLTHPVAFDSLSREIDTALAPIPNALLRAKAREEYLAKGVQARVVGLIQRGDVAQASAELDGGRYDRMIPPTQKAALVNATRAAAADKARGLARAIELGEDADPAALAEAARISGDEGITAEAAYRIEVGASESALRGGGGVKANGGFSEAADFTIALEGGDATIKNDNGKGVSRWGINQAANPDLDVTNLDRPGAVARYRKYWRAVDGDRLPRALANVAFDAAVLFGPDDAKRWLAESDGDVGRFLGMERAEMKRLAAADPAKYGDDLKGWLNRVDKVQARAAQIQAFANTQDGVTSDPIKFALGGGGRAPLTNVPALPEGDDPAAWDAAWKGRLQVGRMMNSQWRAPLRLLTDGEAAFMKDRIAQDPFYGIKLAGSLTESVGGPVARTVMGELGQQSTASVQIHIADLAAAGSKGFATQAAQGLALKGKGQALEAADAAELKAELERMKPLFAGNPDLMMAVRSTAEAAMIAQGATGEAKDARYNLNSAIGATRRNGVLYGGVTDINGRSAILPPWLANDHADDVLEYLALGWETAKNGPVFTNGKPMPAASVSRAALALMPSGKYRLLDRSGAALIGPGGRAFEFDLDAAAPGLRRRFGPKAVQEGW